MSRKNKKCLSKRNVVLRFVDWTIGILMEIISLIIVILSIPLAFVNNNPKKMSLVLPGKRRKATVLIHGFLHNRSAWIYHKPKLDKTPQAGDVYTLNLGSPFKTIEQYAEILREQVKEIQRQANGEPLDLNFVGHSMGGLVAVYYAHQYAKENASCGLQINNIVTLASPLQGTYMALLASWCCPCAKEMLPNHPLQDELKWPKCVSIGCGADLLVSPYRSYLKGRENRHVIPYMSHMGVLYSPTVHAYILEGLEAGKI